MQLQWCYGGGGGYGGAPNMAMWQCGNVAMWQYGGYGGAPNMALSTRRQSEPMCQLTPAAPHPKMFSVKSCANVFRQTKGPLPVKKRLFFFL